jgi:arylsulfatase A-like enzyme
MRAVRRSNWKYIETQPGNPGGMPEHQLFDLAVDQGERRNLAAAEPDRVTQLLADADRIQAWAVEHAVTTEQTEIDATTLQQLRNIGY